MGKEQMEFQRKSKVERRKYIRQAAIEHPFDTSVKLVEILNEYYGISASQPTVNRDLNDMGYITDSMTGNFIPGDKERRNIEGNYLVSLFQESNAVQIKEDTSSFLLKTDPAYTQLVASRLEALLALDDIPSWSFIGINGSLMVYFPSVYVHEVDGEITERKNTKFVDHRLKQLFEHASKKKRKY